MKKNYRKPLVKIHNVKVNPLMQTGSIDIGEGTGEDLTKERNTGDWEEF